MRQVIAAALAYPGLSVSWLLEQPPSIFTTSTSIQEEWT